MPDIFTLFCLAAVVALYERSRRLQRRCDSLAERLRRERGERDGRGILLARTLRHSFLNDLQVITGWLQLGNAGRAGAQAEHVRDRLVREGQLMRAKPVGLVMGILNRGAWAEANGVTMTYVVTADLAGFEDCDDDFAGPVSDALGGLIEAIQAADGRACTVSVGLTGGLPTIDVSADVVVADEALPACVAGLTLSRIADDSRSGFRIVVARRKADGD